MYQSKVDEYGNDMKMDLYFWLLRVQFTPVMVRRYNLVRSFA